jgi:cytochrome c-type biogenesis protein CcmH
MNARLLTLSLIFASFIGLTAALPVSAQEAAPLAADPVAEKRLQELSLELRCLVCQNQTIADSNAELAVDLRREIRDMIKAGKSNGEIIEFMVVRYGDFVLYRPPVKDITLLLWGGPIALMLAGMFILIQYMRRRAIRIAAEEPLSADETQRADALLKEFNTK